MIRSPRYDRITQGSIFCGAIANGYKGLPVWGIVITARCDTAHNKVPIVNYLPLVRIEDWMRQDGGRLVIGKALSDTVTGFKNLLTQRSLCHSLMEVYPPSAIVETHFPLPEETQQSKKTEKEAKQAQQARSLALEFDFLNSCLSNLGGGSSSILEVLQRHRKCTQEVADGLLSQKIAGYYYIPDIGQFTEHRSLNGYVADLREVRYIGKDTAKLLTGGIDEGHALELNVDDLAFDAFDFAVPVAEIISPWIEHLMQAFCNLFGRIGVSDLDKTRVTAIVDTVAPQVKDE